VVQKNTQAVNTPDCCGCGACFIWSSMDCVISCTARSGQTDVAQRITDDDSNRNSAQTLSKVPHFHIK